MAITRTKQDWSIGSKVNVGYRRNMEVVEIIKVRGEPDNYRLVDPQGRRWTFIPHNGCFSGWFPQDSKFAGWNSNYRSPDSRDISN